ncbi:MAG: NHLP leader peptide family RiPP precursor [Gammaproteobacteria bacterium]|jgi:hypothetical protein|nr:NHLP leader peptide family RiPP precursor [Gammaproteobacteria bacterium]
MTETESQPKKTTKIIARAMRDDVFREELLTNPKAAIQKEFGKELPPELELRVVEEAPNVVYLVLPARQTPTDELSEDELEAVAGGFTLADSSHRGTILSCYPLDMWLDTVLK